MPMWRTLAMIAIAAELVLIWSCAVVAENSWFSALTEDAYFVPAAAGCLTLLISLPAYLVGKGIP